MRHARAIVVCAVLALCLGHATSAEADGSRDASAAQILFEEGVALMKQDRYGLACPKLEESLRLDYGVGTEFNLAECNEHLGRIATAWSGFLNVASVANAQSQPLRAKAARERAAMLEPRLPTLRIDVPPNFPSAAHVRRDGVLLGPAAWGVALPVDPGTHRIGVTAPGKEPLEATVTAAEGTAVRVSVPATFVTLAPASGPASSPPSPVVMLSTRTGHQEETPLGPPAPDRTQETIGWVMSGLGAAALGTGLGFGIHSLQMREASKRSCREDICSPQGVRQRNQAIESGDVATAVGLAGGAVLLGGVVLLLTSASPSSSSEPSKNAAKASIRPTVNVARNGGGLGVEGLLP